MFNKVKPLLYPYEGGVELAGIALANLPARLSVDRSYIIEEHVVSDGELPEALAYRLYKSAGLHWTLLYVNAIRDPYEEWPMRDGFLKTWADSKYGFNTTEVIHHLVDTRTGRQMYGGEAEAIMSAGPPYPYWVLPVSWLEWRRGINNARRNIVAITPRYIRDFCDLYEELIK